MRAALVLVPLALLAACGGQPADGVANSAATTEATAASPVANGWTGLFNAPDAAIGAARKLGFDNAAYKPTGAKPAYQAHGGPMVIAGADADLPNRAVFEARGTAESIASLSFTLALSAGGTADKARTRLADLVDDYLETFAIDGDTMNAAIQTGQDATGTLSGAPWTIDEDEAANRLTVTFNRPADMTPGTTETRG